MDILSYLLSKKYTDNSIAGGGISAGKNCVVDSITDITGGHRVTFKWTLDNGIVQTGTMDVMDGQDGSDGAKGDKGDTGLGIKSVAVNAEDHLIVTYTDDTTEDAGQIEIMAAVDSVNGKTGEVTLSASDVGALPDDTAIPSKTSDLTNDSNFVDDASYVHTDNNYDATAKGIVDGVTSALADKVDKVQGKGLSTNDYTDADKAEVAKVADKADAEDVIDGASYDSTNHLILFKNGTTTLFSLDAAAFVKDGMVDDVEIVDGNLVITFNTDAGKQAISIPLTDIFDPANYYTKTATDGLLADKADKVASATNGNFAGLDANGNLTDSGKKAADFATPSDIAGQQSLLKDTVGWTGKNLLPNKVWAFSLSSGSVGSATYQANANATGFCCKVEKNKDYIVSRKSSTDANKRFTVVLSANEPATNGVCEVIFANADATEHSFNSGNYEYVFVYCGLSLTDKDIRAMLRRADIVDDTWEPYHESVETMYEEEIHGVNLLDLKSVNAQEGITYVIDNNNRVALSGTLSQGNWLFQYSARVFSNAVKLKQGEYVFSIGVGIPNVSLQVGYTHPTTGEYTQVAHSESGASELKFTSPVSDCPWTIQLVSGAVTLSSVVTYPMLRKADIEDSTYRPYNPQSIQHQLDAQGVLGAKNLLPNNATSQTINGVTFTVNADGSVTVNGTASANTDFPLYGSWLVRNNNIYKAGVPYHVSMKSSKNAGYHAYVQTFVNGVAGTVYVNSGTEGTFTIASASEDGIRIMLVVENGATFNNDTVYPMLRLASDPDNTYQPYAMTNRELTEKLAVQDLSSQIQWETGYFEPIVNSCKFIKYDGKYMFRLQGELVQATGSEYIKIAKLPFTLPTFYGTTFPVWTSRSNWVDMNIETNGDVKIRTQSLATGTLIIQLVL